MKSGVSVLNRDTGFKTVRMELTERYGREAAQRIWNNAGRILEELCASYADLPAEVKVHTDGNMFRNAAVYMAIKEEHPDAAMEIVEIAMRKEGRRVARMIGALLRIPGAKRLFMGVFAKMLENYFNEAAGFRSTKHCINKREVRFDILQCPYCKYLTEIGCPELVRISCEIDEVIYGNLPGFEFSRTGTIGTGSSCCDFCLKRQ